MDKGISKMKKKRAEALDVPKRQEPVPTVITGELVGGMMQGIGSFKR